MVQKNDAQSSAFDVFDTLSNHAQVKQDIASYTKYFDKPVDKTLRIDMTLHGKTSKDLSLKMQHPHGTGTVML